MVPPPDRVDRQVEGVEAVGARLLHHLLGHRVGHERGHLLREARAGRTVRLHAHRVDHRVGARPSVISRISPATSSCSLRSSTSIPLRLARSIRSGTRVHGDHPEAEVFGDPGRHVAYRPQAEHGHAAALGYVRVGDRLPARRQDVREVDKALVGRASGTLMWV